MMCVEKIQRLMMATVLSISFYCLTIPSLNSIGLFFLGFVIVMIVVWAITDFCPSIWILGKFMPKCGEKKENE
jgi:multisubunit Na+/H+ antiporter MnhE subunit